MKPDLSLGQHFMIDDDLLRQVVTAAHITSHDIVLEVGPGRGALTRHLLAAQPQHLICVEQDGRCRPLESFNKNLTWITGTIFDVIEELEFNKVVANLPYHICEPLFVRLLKNMPERIVVVVSKHFSTVLLGETILGLIIRESYDVKILQSIHPRAFDPSPRTNSSLLSLERKTSSPFALALRTFYTHPRSKVKNFLLAVTEGIFTKNEAKQRLEKSLSSLSDRRLYTLSTEEFKQLAIFLKHCF